MKKEISYGAAHGEDRSYSKNEFITQVSERCYPSTWTFGERKKKNAAKSQSVLTEK